jgi:hypothetical protein
MKLSAITLALLAPLALAAASPAAEAAAEDDGYTPPLCPNFTEPPTNAFCLRACYSLYQPCFKCQGKLISYPAEHPLAVENFEAWRGIAEAAAVDVCLSSGD